MNKFIEFKKQGDDIIVLSRKDKTKLGKIRYYKLWGEPVFEPEGNTVFSLDCLISIQQKLRLNKYGF